MQYLLLGIICSAMIAIVLRFSENHISNKMAMFASNYLVCVLCGLIYINPHQIEINYYFYFTLISGILSGILYLVCFVFTKINMEHNGIILTSTFNKLGVLIPTLMAILLFHDIPSLLQVIAIIIAVSAIVIIHFEKGAMKEGNKKIYLILLLIIGGFVDSTTNLFKQYGHIDYENLYLVLTFFSAFVCALILSLKNKWTYKDVIFGVLIGIPNYFSSKLVLMSLNTLRAIIVYPVYSVGTLCLITIVGLTVFKEHLSVKKIIALIMILIALCLLNI